MKKIWALGVVLLVAGLTAALDVPMRDGTVIEAESYRVTGSYVMIKLANGSQVAYDVADVDLEALRAAEAAAASETEPAAAGAAESTAASDALVGSRSLKDAASIGQEQSTSPSITDRDVRHVRGSGVQGGAESEGGSASGAGDTPPGFQQGGGVVLNSLRVTPSGEGAWVIDGEVVNRLTEPVTSVRVKLEASTGSGDPWQGEVALSGALAPNETGIFQRTFRTEAGAGGAQPNVRANVIWMQQTTRREPDYTKAGGVPHPSNLPQQFGGVAGADPTGDVSSGDVVVLPTPTPIE
jgi:hypothetical protein